MAFSKRNYSLNFRKKIYISSEEKHESSDFQMNLSSHLCSVSSVKCSDLLISISSPVRGQLKQLLSSHRNKGMKMAVNDICVKSSAIFTLWTNFGINFDLLLFGGVDLPSKNHRTQRTKTKMSSCCDFSAPIKTSLLGWAYFNGTTHFLSLIYTTLTIFHFAM